MTTNLFERIRSSKRIKPLVKHFIQRLARVEEVRGNHFLIEAFGLQPPSIDFNLLLHQSRSALLRAMPSSGVHTLISAGCSGSWYFEWIESHYGSVKKHIGIEYYSPQPSDLPQNVEWIVNTVSEMSDIQDKSCELVFSGQNIEHLWPEEISGFLLEAARVISTGGHLVIDSPNREFTNQFNWSHPEHIIELTVEEIKKLVKLAGFDVVKVHGIWLCQDPLSNRLLSLEPNADDLEWSTTERVISAIEQPQRSFIWWLEACRSDRPPAQKELEIEVKRIFEIAWPERITRTIAGSGMSLQERPQKEGEGNELWVISKVGQSGILIYGPYMPLNEGSYTAVYSISCDGKEANQIVAHCDVLSRESDVPIAVLDVKAADLDNASEIRVSFQLSKMTFGMQFRCQSMGKAKIACRKAIKLEQGE